MHHLRLFYGPLSFSSSNMKRSRDMAAAAVTTPPSTPPPSPHQNLLRYSRKNKTIPRNPKSLPLSTSDPQISWVPLNIGKKELYLPFTFPTGQTFRWKRTGTLQYTGVIGSCLVSLKQLDNGDVGYHFHSSTSCEGRAKDQLFDFLNLGISLCEIWEGFKGCDPRFDELAGHLEGARVLRQDPLECLIQFICSSNNHIQRISKMVDFVSSLGICLGSVGGYDFYEFPKLDRLAMVSDADLREAGFGYRAKYITGTIEALQSKPCGGVSWLSTLRTLDIKEAIAALTTLPGVGPKVAACVALFSLDKHHAIPVDTHVWQIATKYLVPELAGARLTTKLCTNVAEAFVKKYGKYAGWAQTLLFIAELPPQKAIIQSSCWNKNGSKRFKSVLQKDE